ncbi:MAG: CDP-diacylglycerol--serine O-phosphatidyltransferase [Acidobacteria bacterium]|nr:CDP-diacylglycerol--serine O-phosphatidyltransferase [Acidobacteriota bacterium]
MPRLRLSDRLIDPRYTDRRPRRAAYVLPTLFTAGNIFLGFVSILQTFRGAMLVASQHNYGWNPHFESAAVMIGIAMVLDGLDGRIARMTNTVSDFGRELDSLADVITFGIAPAVLAYAWGVQFIGAGIDPAFREQLQNVGYFAAFMYLVCGAARLSRFNVQTNPVPKNPGRPDRKYFVGVPIPAAASLVAAVVFAANSAPIVHWPFAVMWMSLIAVLGFLMVCTWRYRSFKDLNLMRPRSPLTVILLAAVIYLILNYAKPVLLGFAVAYVGSGILVRIGGSVRRHFKRNQPVEAA